MATMTWQDLINLQNQYPGASREQLAAIQQQQQAAAPPPITNPGTGPSNGGIDTGTGAPPVQPTAGSPTAGPTGGVGGGTFTPTNASAKTFFDNLFPGQTLTPQMLLDNEAQLNANGIKLIKNAAGQPGKISLPDGSAFDVIQGAGAGTNLKQWNQIAGPGGSTAGFGGGGTSASNPWGAMGQMMGSLGYNVAGSFAPWTQTWQAPTAEQALNSPGVQFALNNAMRTMENSAAAQGVLGNARAQEAIANNLGQQLLGNYNQIFGQALTSYQQNQQDFFANEDRPWAKGMQVANVGLQANQI